MGIVYLIRNRISGKQFVGVTQLDVRMRWYLHCSAARRGASTPLHTDITKYGTNAFEYSVLKKGLTVTKEAMEEERLKAIKKYKTMVPKGYNTPGYVYAIIPRKVLPPGQFNKRARLTEDQLIELFRLRHTLNQQELADKFGVSQPAISKILRNLLYRKARARRWQDVKKPKAQ